MSSHGAPRVGKASEKKQGPGLSNLNRMTVGAQGNEKNVPTRSARRTRNVFETAGDPTLLVNFPKRRSCKKLSQQGCRQLASRVGFRLTNTFLFSGSPTSQLRRPARIPALKYNNRTLRENVFKKRSPTADSPEKFNLENAEAFRPSSQEPASHADEPPLSSVFPSMQTSAPRLLFPVFSWLADSEVMMRLE